MKIILLHRKKIAVPTAAPQAAPQAIPKPNIFEENTFIYRRGIDNSCRVVNLFGSAACGQESVFACNAASSIFSKGYSCPSQFM